MDMRAFGVKLHPSFIETIFAQLLLISDSHSSAFQLYTYLREIDPTILTETGYAHILKQFADLSYEDDPLPSQSQYLDIVNDMRNAGIPRSAYLYTILFSRYAALAAQIAPAGRASQAEADKLASQSSDITPEVEKRIDAFNELQQRLLSATKRLHSSLKLDASTTPDTATMNALMNAYNRLGAYRYAYAIWEQLEYGSPPYDHASISIALDLCGYASDRGGAGSVWNRVTKPITDKHKLLKDINPRLVIPNANNWAALIECYARLGDFDTALTHFRRMLDADEDSWIPKPTFAIVETLVKFSWNTQRRVEVEELIKAKLPDMYPLLPQPKWDAPS